MNIKIKKEKGKYVASFGSETKGFEFIYLNSKNRNERILLFENRMAKRGFWMNDKQVSDLIKLCFNGLHWEDNLTPFIQVGDRIEVESIKNRGEAPGKLYQYQKDGTLKYSWDCFRDLEVIE